MDNEKECSKSVYSALNQLSQKIDQANEQITLLRIDHAETKIKLQEGRKLQSTVFGLLGGILSAIISALVEIFKK